MFDCYYVSDEEAKITRNALKIVFIEHRRSNPHDTREFSTSAKYGYGIIDLLKGIERFVESTNIYC